MKKILFLLGILTLFSANAFADIRLPDTPKPTPAEKEITGKMYIRVKSDVKEPTLTIKQSTLKQLRAAIDEADDAQTLAENNEGRFNFTRTQTIVSGLFFSLAFIFGGVWMFRAKGKSSKIAVSLIGLAVLSAGAGVAFANTPPSYVISLTSRIFDKSTYAYGWAEGNVKIKISDDNSQRYDIKLEIPNGEKDKRNDE